jgi:ABC-2 type transport system ATP-binding protein
VSEALVRVEALAKTFYGRRGLREIVMPWRRPKATEALRGVDLEVRRGELVAVVGPNGAGKTTLLEILATLVRPTSGRALVAGVDVAEDPDGARQRIGYVLTDERSFFFRLSCKDNLRFFAALQGLFGKAADDRIGELAALLGLEAELPKDFMDLSSGQKQRTAIARGLLADPPVLLFDEATRSLDPGRAARVRRVIREVLVDRGAKAVLFATHDLEEARLLSDRTVLMTEGRIAAQGAFAELEEPIAAVFAEEARREDEAYERLFGAERGAA